MSFQLRPVTYNSLHIYQFIKSSLVMEALVSNPDFDSVPCSEHRGATVLQWRKTPTEWDTGRRAMSLGWMDRTETPTKTDFRPGMPKREMQTLCSYNFQFFEKVQLRIDFIYDYFAVDDWVVEVRGKWQINASSIFSSKLITFRLIGLLVAMKKNLAINIHVMLKMTIEQK